MCFSDFELNILEILRDDARTGHDRIAVMTGSDEETVSACIKSMEERGIIVKYATMINWDLADGEEVEALIEVRVTPQRDQGFDAIAERIYRFDEVSSVFLMSGAYDLMVLVRGRTIRQLALFVSEKLSTLEHVNSTATHFVLKKYKNEGVILEGVGKDERLAVSP
jgi:DNA-binding Lrp family transcriptional regulator